MPIPTLPRPAGGLMRGLMPVLMLALGLAAAASAAAQAAGPRADLMNEFAARARAADPGFSGFSAKRGETLFRKHFATGKPETPACTSCHSDSPFKTGETRAGKAIDPMAVSANPERYTDPRKVAKWFRRNCKSVLGRECTPREKGDFLAFMTSQ